MVNIDVPRVLKDLLRQHFSFFCSNNWWLLDHRLAATTAVTYLEYDFKDVNMPQGLESTYKFNKYRYK